MIRKILEFLDNKKELEETKAECSKMREVLIYNINSSDILVEDIRGVLDSNDYGNKYNKKAKIIELLDDYQSIK